jgi:hypothetical protein
MLQAQRKQVKQLDIPNLVQTCDTQLQSLELKRWYIACRAMKRLCENLERQPSSQHLIC